MAPPRLHLDADTSMKALHLALMARGHDVMPCSWSMRHTVDLPAPIPPVKPYTAIRLAPLSISTRLYSAAIPGYGPLQLDCGIYRGQ
jgi:hypothetical protein